MVLNKGWVISLGKFIQRMKRNLQSTKHQMMKVDWRSIIFFVMVFLLLRYMMIKRQENNVKVFDAYQDYAPAIARSNKLTAKQKVASVVQQGSSQHEEIKYVQSKMEAAPTVVKVPTTRAVLDSKYDKYKHFKCNLKPPVKRKHVEPLIKLDKTKFLFPLLVNGPNNQILGLRDSIYLAIKLNRTLIVPYFIKHKTDSSGAFDQVPAEARMDVDELKVLIPTVPHAQLQQVCRNKVDSVFLSEVSKNMHATLPYERISKLAGLNVDKPKDSSPGVEMLPRNEHDLIIKLNDINVPKLRNMYKSNGRCAVYVHPFRTVGAHESSPKMREAKIILEDYEENNIRTQYDQKDEELVYSLGFMSTGHPQFVKQIADEFRNKVMHDASVLAVHYRFDPNDWMIRCAKPAGNTVEINKMCQQLDKIKPIDIANGLFAYINGLSRGKTVQVQAIYFAAPLTLSNLISEVRVLFDKNVAKNYGTKIPIFTYVDLEKFLGKYINCQHVGNNFEDVLSLVEMEICLKSISFISSQSSSWSNIVMRHRVANKVMKYDSHTLMVVWEAYLERTKGSS
ncbi:uncharacterized protein LOC100180089 [Ciona intestinalis]